MTKQEIHDKIGKILERYDNSVINEGNSLICNLLILSIRTQQETNELQQENNELLKELLGNMGGML